MIKYKNKEFKDYIQLYDFMINIQKAVEEKYFLHSNNFYIRDLLKQKFKQSFEVRHIRNLLKEIYKETF